MGTEGEPADGCIDHAIAVVGMACRFPGDATNVEAFWEMIRDGRDAWSEIPKDRFNAKGWYHPDPNRPGSFHIKGAHFIKSDIAAFDAPFFSISTAEAVSMDPQQRMLLEVVYEALESAGIPSSSLSNTDTSVFCGSFVRDYEQPCMRDPDTTPPYSATGNGIAILANRISHAFDFAGTSQTIDTGCSASMIAVHQACKSLLSGESNVGIATGVGLIFSPNTLVPMANLNILGADGRCYTFDERASGYGRGEGTGVIVLKRLQDAVAANDTIRAIIRATASNQDGHTQGITLPSKERQVENMTEVYRGSGLDVTRTAYMECHGTGTQVGDMKETQAITGLFCQHRTPDNPLMIGSVKTNIGHLEGSAGVAGIIKGILVVERGFIPKHLNFNKPNPNIDFEGMRLKIAQELTPWPVPGLRRASVNSFGFGGTNAHVVLDDAPHFLSEAQITGANHNTFLFPGDRLKLNDLYNFRGPLNHLFVFSGHDEAALTRVIESQAGYVAKQTQQPAFETNYTYTLLNRRSRLNWRTYVVASSTADLLQKLESKTIVQPVRGPQRVPSRVGLIFCGQGAQWYAMGLELLSYHTFYVSISSASWYLKSVLGSPFSLWDELHRSKEQSKIDDPSIAQPATTAIQVALVDLLLSAGLEPSSVVGHSSGEIAAAYAVGAISRENAWKIAYCRGQCVSRIETLAPCLHGGMLAVALSEEDARRGIADAGVSLVDIACINGPLSVTLSGDACGITSMQEYFRKRGCRATRVNVDTAYHSHHMVIIEDLYMDCLKGLEPCSPKTNAVFYSSVFGRPASACELGAEYWVKNLTCPVQFFSAVKSMTKLSNPDLFIEVSPHRVWESTVHQIHSALDRADATSYISLLHRNKDASETFLEAMGDLWTKGLQINLDWANNTCGKRPRHLVDVPSYPWDHSKKYWHESHLSKTNRFRKHGREDIIGAPLENATPQDPRWRGFFRVQENPWLEDHVVQMSVLYPAGGLLAMAIEAAKQMADPKREVLGYEVTKFKIIKPMLIPSTTQGLENMLSARIVDDDDDEGDRTHGSNTAVYNFSIMSKPTDGPWTTHAKGRFMTVYCKSGETPNASMEAMLGAQAHREACRLGQARCHTKYNPRQFYEMLDIVGLTYGPQFRNLVQIEKGDTSAHTVVEIPDTRSRMPFQFEFDHIIHPATLDAMIQSVLALGDDGEAMLPCAADRVFVSANLPKGAGARFRGYTTAEKNAARGATANITMFDDELHAPAVIIEKLQLKSVSGRAGSGSDSFLPAHRNLCSEIVWKQDTSSIAALDAALPTTILGLVDAAAHKNPALSILFHISDAVIPSFDGTKAKEVELHQLEIVAETLKATNIVFDNLTAGYCTPRFSQCTLSGVSAKKVWQHMRLLKGTHPGFQRMQYSAVVAEDAKHDLVLCSIVDSVTMESLSTIFDKVADNGWLILLSKLGEAIGCTQYEAIRCSLHAAGFKVDGMPAKSCVFISAQKIKPYSNDVNAVNAIDGHSPSLHNVIFLVPNSPSDAVNALKKALRPRIEDQLSVTVRDVSACSLATLEEQDRNTLVVSFVEIDFALVFSMDQAIYNGLHRLLNRSRGVLWLMQGAQVGVMCPERAPFTGLARTLRSESNKKRILTLDIVDNLALTSTKAPSLSSPSSSGGLVRAINHLFKRLLDSKSPSELSDDVEFAYADGHLLVPRLMPMTLLNHAIENGTSSSRINNKVPLLSHGRALELDASSLGSQDGPSFMEDTVSLRRPLCPTEMRIAVSGTNLLPEDILAASSGIPVATIGTDVFGFVLEAGSACSQFKPGDYVSARMRDTPRTHVIVDVKLVQRIQGSDKWNAVCPTALATVVYAMHTSRKIKDGEHVLVFAPMTAYGQAAMWMVRTLGGHVLVACSSAAERAVLKEHFKVPVKSIMDALDGPDAQGTDRKLQDQVMSLTDGKGADVVFDPTSRHLEEAFSCVAECGRVIRVAQRDTKKPSQSHFCLPSKNASLETVDLDLLDARRSDEALRLSSDMDKLTQMPSKLQTVSQFLEYNMCDVQTAVQHATSNLYSGAHVLYTAADVGQNMVNTSVQLTQPTELSWAWTYVLVGGLGGLGRSIAEHLVQKGARHIAFFSRSGACTPEAQALVAKLREKGVQVAAFATDICNEKHLAETISEVERFMPPIRGTIQCAAVVDDASFPSMDYDRWRRAFEPKTRGSQNLHKLLPKNMDFFIFLSSSSGVIGNRGQANYSAGNSYQDALAQHRSLHGMHSVSLDLGLVLGAGMVAENESLLDAMKASGFIGIRITDVLFLLDRAMARPETEQKLKLPPQIVTTVGTGGLTIQNQPSDPFWTRTALFRYLNQVDAPPHGLNTGACQPSDRDLRALVQSATSLDEAASAVSTALIATVARRKGMVPSDFDAHESLGSYGIDSLDAIFVLGWIGRETGVTVQTVEGPSITELSRDIAKRTLDAMAMEV